MRVIKTSRKEKLPKGFSYPLGAEAISAALDGIPQFDNAVFWFSWRDEFWVSRWRKRLKEHGPVVLLQIAYSEYFRQWDVRVYSVPSEHAVFAREQLHAKLPRVRSALSALEGVAKTRKISITLDLREAEKAANLAAPVDAPTASIAKSSAARKALPAPTNPTKK